MIYDFVVNIILFLFSVVDFKFYKVKNDMIILSLCIITFLKFVLYGINQENIKKIIISILVLLISQVILSILSMIVTVSSGDIKLIGLILYMLGVSDGLSIIFLGSCISLFPMYTKIVGRVPLGFMFYIGYLIHIYIMRGRVI